MSAGYISLVDGLAHNQKVVGSNPTPATNLQKKNKSNKIMELTQLTTDAAKEREGVWFEYDAETSFLIGSLNGRAYREAFQKRYEALRLKFRTNIPPTESELANLQCYADAILLGWKGLKNNGEEFPYTKENSLMVLKNCPTLREFVFASAANHDNFKFESAEAAKAALGKP